MDKCYEHVLRHDVADVLAKYRKRNDLSQRDVEELLYISHAYVSLIENASSKVAIKTLTDILDQLYPEYNYDDSFIKKTDAMFDTYFIKMVKEDPEYMKLWQRILDIKDKIKASLCHYRLSLYSFIDDVTHKRSNAYSDIEEIKEDAIFLSEKDRQILDDYLGLYYHDQKEADMSFYHYANAINLYPRLNKTIAYGIALKSIVLPLTKKRQYDLAMKCINLSSGIFEKYHLEELIKDNTFNRGNVFMHIRQYDLAISIFNDFLDDEKRHYGALNNIFLCHLRMDDEEAISNMIDDLKDEDIASLYPSTIVMILTVLFKRQDKEAFSIWYDRVQTRSDISLIDKKMIALLKKIITDGYDDMAIMMIEDLILNIDKDENYDEYVNLLEIAYEAYSTLGDTKKAKEITTLLYKAHKKSPT